MGPREDRRGQKGPGGIAQEPRGQKDPRRSPEKGPGEVQEPSPGVQWLGRGTGEPRSQKGPRLGGPAQEPRAG